MKYHIYHPKSGKINHDESLDQPFTFVASVEAQSLEGAFKMSQNDFNEEYAKLNIRSTSIGDIIKLDSPRSYCYMIEGTGFKQLNLVAISMIHEEITTHTEELDRFTEGYEEIDLHKEQREQLLREVSKPADPQEYVILSTGHIVCLLEQTTYDERGHSTPCRAMIFDQNFKLVKTVDKFSYYSSQYVAEFTK